MEIKKKSYTLKTSENRLAFFKGEELFIEIPLDVSVNGVNSEFKEINKIENRIVLKGRDELLSVTLYDDCVTFSYKKSFNGLTPIYEVKAFGGGIKFPRFDRAFCPQARHNSHKNLDWFSHFPDISSNGYYIPSLLQFSLGSPMGYVGFGLLDIPDTKLCRLTEEMMFLVQSSGGNIKTCEYIMPEIVIYFPKDEWDAISTFRELLIRFGKYVPSKKPTSDIPNWWKRPMVCIYGDQLIESCVGQSIDEAWVDKIVVCAEKEWEMTDFNLVIDDSWQLSHSMTPVVDVNRFPDLRGFIEKMHERGHRVLLWMTPLIDKITNGFETKSQKLGVVTDYECPMPYYNAFPGTYFLDYTSDSARQFIRETVELLFGKGEDQLGADGVKLDFLADHRDPSLTENYQHPERGIGMREVYRFYEMFYQEAKRVNSEVLIDATVGDPRFEKFVDLNRMHDTHSGNLEKELRVRVSSLACPDLLIDSDGAVMFKAWLKSHYIDAAVYGIPANYYTQKYHDYKMSPEGYGYVNPNRVPEEHERLSIFEKKQLGRLFEMVRYRPNGHPEYVENGWILKDGENINAQSFGGSTVVYYPWEKSEKGYIFTFKDEAIIIPLYGRNFGRLCGGKLVNQNIQIDYARGHVILHIEPGKVYTFENIDEGDSIDKLFLTREGKIVEGDINYVN